MGGLRERERCLPACGQWAGVTSGYAGVWRLFRYSPRYELLPSKAEEKEINYGGDTRAFLPPGPALGRDASSQLVGEAECWVGAEGECLFCISTLIRENI